MPKKGILKHNYNDEEYQPFYNKTNINTNQRSM